MSKKAVTKCAVRERWQERLARVESTAQERADVALAEELQDVTERHLRMLRAIQHRGLVAVQRLLISTAMQAVRAIELSIRAERAILDPAESSGGGDVRWEDALDRAFARGTRRSSVIDVEAEVAEPTAPSS